MSTNGTALSVENLAFRYEREAFTLRVPALEIGAGERVAFTGPSGCGKTTLLHLLAGILEPQAGRVTVLGRDVGALGDAERRTFRIGQMGLIFQAFELIDHLTVRENVLLPYFVSPALTLDAEARASLERLTDSVGIEACLDRKPRRLSQGERQRAAICRALVTEPPLVLADEPTGNLDPDNTRTILRLTVDEVTKRDATFIMVTHDHSLLDAFDRVIDFGDLVAGGAS